MHPDHPTTSESNPYTAPQSDLNSKPSSSQEWSSFHRRCAGKIYFRLGLAGFASWGIYRFISELMFLLSVNGLGEAFYVIFEFIVFLALGAMLAFGGSKIGVVIASKTSTVTKFVQDTDTEKWLFDQPLLAAFVAMLVCGAVEFSRASVQAFLAGDPIWPPPAPIEMLASVAVATLVVYPLYRVVFHSRLDIQKRMSSHI